MAIVNLGSCEYVNQKKQMVFQCIPFTNMNILKKIECKGRPMLFQTEIENFILYTNQGVNLYNLSSNKIQAQNADVANPKSIGADKQLSIIWAFSQNNYLMLFNVFNAAYIRLKKQIYIADIIEARSLFFDTTNELLYLVGQNL